MAGHRTSGLQNNNSEKCRLELFWGRLSDGQVNGQKRRKMRARIMFLALVLKRERKKIENNIAYVLDDMSLL